ncbi:MAG: DUF692 domain-containing protein [Kiloniellaceae bacterium]
MTVAATIPARAGVGLKAQHYEDILGQRPDIGWFEVHAENYMGAGGPPHHYLEAIRRDYPISLHGVGLSIGADRPLDEAHLQRLKVLHDRYEPGLVSEHLAWSSHGGVFFNDLLPVPYTGEAVARVSEHIDRLQSVLGRRVLLENPSTYVSFEASEMSELDFLQAVSLRAGCYLLLDVNNVLVSATNQNFSAEDYIDAFPMEAVREIHLAGHARDRDDAGNPLLIDAHDRAVDDRVWSLYARAIARSGMMPTLIEWDNAVPDWRTLFAEACTAERIMTTQHALHAETAHAAAG